MELREFELAGKRPRVLCVEDDPDLARIIQRTLQNSGYVVDVAHSRKEFRALIDSDGYQVVMIDHRLPDGSGIEIIERYAKADSEPGFIMLSGVQETALAVSAMRAGALDYLAKDGDSGFLELLPVVVGNAIERLLIRSKERQLQSELLDADRKLSAALRASPVPTMLFDADGIIHQVNRAWCESIGIRTTRGFSLGALLHATFVNPEEIRHSLDQAQSGPVELIVQVRVMHGRPKTWKLSIAALPAGEEESDIPLLFVCHGLDISDSIELEHQLRSLSLEDALTGLPNRRSLQERLPAELSRAQRESSHVTVAMIDIDHFKAYNDYYGHLEGDRCLVQVATSLRSTLRRPTDYVARFGGEEFAIVLPGTDDSGARIILETVRAAVEELAVAHKNSSSGEIVTVSIGFACSSTMGDPSAEEILDAADVALFAAKDRGRNRVVAHPA
jgi:diguanylate cyclase (GGDEF)-like protein